MHDLIQYNDRSKARCTTSSSVINSLREQAKKGQAVNYQISEYKGLRLRDVTREMIEESIRGRFELAEKKKPEHLEFLDKFGILEALKRGYEDNVEFGVDEVTLFATQYRLLDNEQGILATYDINHLIKIGTTVIEKAKELTNYSEAGSKFHIDYIIPAVIELIDQIYVGIVSATYYLNLSSVHPFLMYIQNRMDYMYDHLKIELKAGL